jgi:hypothetical protein
MHATDIFPEGVNPDIHPPLGSLKEPGQQMAALSTSSEQVGSDAKAHAILSSWTACPGCPTGNTTDRAIDIFRTNPTKDFRNRDFPTRSRVFQIFCVRRLRSMLTGSLAY